ncbi:hypothetical protein DACRYDRAFT_19812 [Dacryopinax primogenitus]|uniref:Uncharacterized protein n=1 Tax=Dacryopinax primogenitus (strain DJM 731) TaxID=1858805 RepID=M5GGC3_DACPD|nr:uncharacterized protein DACRYDRAFT_19812 [Dacryopinax primogenitus]EJU05238.1 hypothetical protein DACRYDRAFT_19812 [Dacryopinax primogenitus]
MPAFKELLSPHSEVKRVSSRLRLSFIRNFIDSLSSDPKYMNSIRAAVEEDHKYRSMYDEYKRTGKVTPLEEENDSFSLLRFRSRTGGPAGPPKPGDYNDQHIYVCTTRRTLTIHHWLFMHPTLVIDLNSIIRIRPAKDEVTEGGVEPWGVGLTGVCWARDADRALTDNEAYDRSFVCEFKAEDGEEYCAGFTVERPEKFVRVLENLIPGIRAGCSKTSRWGAL